MRSSSKGLLGPDHVFFQKTTSKIKTKGFLTTVTGPTNLRNAAAIIFQEAQVVRKEARRIQLCLDKLVGSSGSTPMIHRHQQHQKIYQTSCPKYILFVNLERAKYNSLMT